MIRLFLVPCWRRRVVRFGHVVALGFFFIELTGDELGFAGTSLQRQALEQDIESFSIAMGEHRAQIEPQVLFAFAWLKNQGFYSLCYLNFSACISQFSF